MANPIVIVNVSQQQAALPADLQRKGAFISQGGTTLAKGEATTLTQFADLEEHLVAPIAIASGSWADGLATINLGATHGLAANTEFTAILAGCTPSIYNGTRKAIATDTDSFTFQLPSPDGDPIGPLVAPFGTVAAPPASELESMARTFFTQPSLQSVSVLELGTGTVAEALDVLQKFIDDNVDQQVFYSYLTPRSWDANSDFLDFLKDNFEAQTAKTYFFITTNVQNWHAYVDYKTTTGTLLKPAFVEVEAPAYVPVQSQAVVSGVWATGLATLTMTSPHGLKPGQYFQITGAVPAAWNGWKRAVNGTTGSTIVWQSAADPGTLTTPGSLVGNPYTSPGRSANEFSLAAGFHRTLSIHPTTTSRVPPLCFSYTFGTTRFPTEGNSALLADIKAENVNYIGYGGEGGISNNMLVWGRFMDGRPWNYWYAVDWVQINAQRALANTIINGSNTTINPLYYNQDGINRLEQSLYTVGNNAVAFGLALGDVRQVGLPAAEFASNLNEGLYAGLVIINAEPFTVYLTHSPGDYRIGRYGGLSFVFTPQRGFEQIIVEVNVTDFVTP